MSNIRPVVFRDIDGGSGLERWAMLVEGNPKKKKKKMVISHSDRVDLWRLKSIMQFYALQLFLDAPVCSYPSVFHLFMSPFMRRTICFYY